MLSAACSSLRQSLCTSLQACVRRGLVAFPSSFLLFHNRPNVHRIRGFITSSYQVQTLDTSCVSAMYLSGYAKVVVSRFGVNISSLWRRFLVSVYIMLSAPSTAVCFEKDRHKVAVYTMT